MAKKQVDLFGEPVSEEDVKTNFKKNEERITIIEKEERCKKMITDKELLLFPRNVRNIESIIKGDFHIEQTLERNIAYYREEYTRNHQFGTCIKNYGISLLEHGKLIKAAIILDDVCGSENFDNEWPEALFQKARIGALLGKLDYTLALLTRSFRAATGLAGHGISPKEKRLKEMAQNLPAFQKYVALPEFKDIITHDYDNKEDKEKFWEDKYPFV